MKGYAISGLTMMVLGVFASPLVGQDRPQTREGFFIGFGLGYASLDCSNCTERDPGLAFQFTLGGTLGDRFLLAFDALGWGKTENEVTLTYSNLSAALFFYPMPESGLFLKGGVGFSALQAEASVGAGTLTVGTDGVGGTVGAGYNIRLGDNFSLTPFGNLLFGSLEDDSSVNVVQLGLGVTWH